MRLLDRPSWFTAVLYSSATTPESWLAPGFPLAGANLHQSISECLNRIC